MTSFEFTFWQLWERLVLEGSSTSGTISALYRLLALQKQNQERGEGRSSENLRWAVEHTIRAIPEDLAFAIASRKQHVELAKVNLVHRSDDCKLDEMCPCMQDAQDTAKQMQETTLHQLSVLRAWLKDCENEVDIAIDNHVREDVHAAGMHAQKDNGEVVLEETLPSTSNLHILP